MKWKQKILSEKRQPFKVNGNGNSVGIMNTNITATSKPQPTTL